MVEQRAVNIGRDKKPAIEKVVFSKVIRAFKTATRNLEELTKPSLDEENHGDFSV